jgi:hypothetical protein
MDIPANTPRSDVRKCRIEGCSRFGTHRSTVCNHHRNNLKKYGSYDYQRPAPPPKPLCKVEGCQKVSDKAGYCNSHYLRLRRNGDPLAGKKGRGVVLNYLKSLIGVDTKECVFWPWKESLSESGRAVVRFQSQNMSASRAVCILAHGPSDGVRTHAAHSCGNGHLSCINPNHLRWATPTENTEDAKLHGTFVCGEKATNAKLTDELVRAIRTDRRTDAEWASIIGCSQQIVGKARRQETWKHVT